MSEGENIRLYLLGMFYNLFLPGGIGGDAYKVWLLHRLRYATVKPLAEAVLLDRINGLVAILMLLVALLPFFPALPFWIRMGAFLLLIGYLCYYLLIKYLFPLFLSSIHLTTVYSLGVQLLQCLSIYCIMKAIGIESDYLAWMFVFMLSSVVAVLPFTVGGLGARELVFLYSCRWLMIEGEAAVTISLLFYAITVIVSFLGIYYYIFPDRLGIETCEEGVEQVEN